MKKQIFRMVALLLSIAIVFSLFGCSLIPNLLEIIPTETTEPTATDPSALDLYNEARKAIDDADDLDVTFNITKKSTVGGEVYTDTVTQVLALQGRNSGTLLCSAENDYVCGEYVFASDEYYDGTQCYLVLESQPFSSTMSQEDYLARYAPTVLIDSSLYGSATSQAGGSNTTILTFSEPTAAEAWAMPDYGELISASGTAVLNADGELTRTTYTIQYSLGTIKVELDVSATVSIPDNMSLSNTLPAAAEDYVELAYIDAAQQMFQAAYYITQADSITFASNETIISYAAGCIYSCQEQYDTYGSGDDLLANISVDLSIMSGNQSQTYEQTENYQDGKYTYTEGDNRPVSQLLDASVIEEYCLDAMTGGIPSHEYLASAEITDLGSVYLLEMTGTEDMATSFGKYAGNTLFNDENLLNDLATAYETTAMDIYLSIDKYTGLPVAFGHYYEGNHTIEGQECLLSVQADYSIFLSSNTSYETITEITLPDEEPETRATPLFYHVTGENGQEMWLIGTIHVGDDRTAYLPKEIYTALENSDALAVEFNSDAFEEAIENDDNLMAQLSAAYFYSDGSETREHLDEEVYESAVKMLKASGNYYPNAEYLKPYLWSQNIDNFYLRQGYDLLSAKGADNRLMEFAREKGIEIRDIESGLFQIQMITGYSDALQQLLLEDTLETTSLEYCSSVAELYEQWCQGDEAVLRETLSDEVDTSEFTEEELAEYNEQLPLIEEYNKAMSYDRNDGMLKVAIDYLESGETVFYAVGLAHLLNDVNGLVDALREAGYTVELVEYS